MSLSSIISSQFIFYVSSQIFVIRSETTCLNLKTVWSKLLSNIFFSWITMDSSLLFQTPITTKPKSNYEPSYYSQNEWNAKLRWKTSIERKNFHSQPSTRLHENWLKEKIFHFISERWIFSPKSLTFDTNYNRMGGRRRFLNPQWVTRKAFSTTSFSSKRSAQ